MAGKELNVWQKSEALRGFACPSSCISFRKVVSCFELSNIFMLDFYHGLSIIVVLNFPFCFFYLLFPSSNYCSTVCPIFPVYTVYYCYTMLPLQNCKFFSLFFCLVFWVSKEYIMITTLVGGLIYWFD